MDKAILIWFQLEIIIDLPCGFPINNIISLWFQHFSQPSWVINLVDTQKYFKIARPAEVKHKMHPAFWHFWLLCCPRSYQNLHAFVGTKKHCCLLTPDRPTKGNIFIH